MDLILTLYDPGWRLLLLETVLPGLIAGVIGGCCLLVGIVLPTRGSAAETGTWILLGTIGALVAGLLSLDRFFQPRLGRRIMLTGVSGNLRNEHPELLQPDGHGRDASCGHPARPD